MSRTDDSGPCWAASLKSQVSKIEAAPGEPTMSLRIRNMEESDLAAARPLMKQLGYDLEPAEIRRRFLSVMAADNHALLVGEREGRLVGLIHVYARPALDKR